MKSRLILWGVLGVLAAARGEVAGQSQAPEAAQEEQTPVLRGPSAFTVVVDAVVTDRRNRVISDLEAEQFRLFEDGVEQIIDSVSFIEPGSSGAAPGEPAAAASEAAVSRHSVRDFRPNLIIFLLDYATTEFTNQKLVRDAAQRYIQESLRPGDYVAVFSLATGFRFLQDFSDDRNLLLAALGGEEVRARALSATAAPALPPGTAGGGEIQPIGVSGGSPADIRASAQAAAASGSDQAQLMLAERIQQLYYTMTSYLGKREAFAVLGAIQAISQVVGEVSGRKTLILFSQGFVVGPHMDAELEKTVSLANRANLAVYGVDSQGLATRDLSGDLVPRSELAAISSAQGRGRIRASGGESLFDRARQVGSDLRDSALRYISSATGGFAIRNTNDLFDSLQRVDQDVRAYYLITYRPRELDFDGKFREIRLEVDRKDVEVRSRSGYIAVPPGMDSLSGDEFQLLRRVNAGEVELDLPVFLRLDRFRGAQQPEVIITLELNGSDIQFGPGSDDRGGRTASLEIIGLIRDLDGQVLNRFGAPVNLNATPEEEQALGQASVRFSNALPLNPGVYSVQTVVRDSIAGRTGRAEQSLRIGEESARLSLSTIVLGKDVEAAPGAAGRLTMEGVRLLPSARREFQPSDQLIYYFEIYPPAAAGAARCRVEVSAQPSGSSDAVALPAYEVSGPGRLASSKYLEMSSLPPGNYFLKVRVINLDSGEEARGQTSFRVMP